MGKGVRVLVDRTRSCFSAYDESLIASCSIRLVHLLGNEVPFITCTHAFNYPFAHRHDTYR